MSCTTAVTAQTALDPVIVTGTREPEPRSRSVADIVVIDAAAIATSTADSLEDLLRRDAGLQLVRNGGPGQSAGYFLRGASTSGTLVLIDGVRIGSASLGQVQLEALPLAAIERIEVLRGPASSLYGADGVGGVVRIVTRGGEGPPRLVGAAALGGYRSSTVDSGASGSAGMFDYAVGVGRERSRGVSALREGDAFGNFNPDADGFSRRYGNARLGVTPATGHRVGLVAFETRLDAQYDASEFLPPTFAQDASADFRNRLTTRVVSLDYRGVLAPAWTTTLQLARHVDDLTSGGTTTSRFITRREQATWQNALALTPEQQLVIAYEHLRDSVDADALADAPSRRNHALVVGWSGRFKATTLQGDVRRDDNSAYGGDTTGRLGIAHEVIPGLKLRALAGTSFRAPTFNDLYFPGFGVADVRPERGRSVELGIAWQADATSASATLFRNRVRDLIEYQPDPAACPPGYDFGCAANVSRARLQGLTLGAAHRWRGWSLRATIDLLDATDADTGVRLPRRASHQEHVSIEHDAGPWSAGGSLLVVGSRPDAGVVLGGYTLVDLRAGWRVQPRWRVEAKLLNALDRRVEPVRDYRGLGRQAWLGIRYDGGGL